MQREQDETSYAQAPAELAARRFRAIPSHRTLGEILAANRTAFGKYALLSSVAAALIADGYRVRSLRERRSLFPDLKASVPVGGEGSRFAKLIAAENGL